VGVVQSGVVTDQKGASVAEPVSNEVRMKRLEEKTAEGLYLARNADKEVADFRIVLSGHTGVLNALRETQLEHGRTLASHGQRLDSLEVKVDRLEVKVDRLEEKVDRGFAKIDERFSKIDERFAMVDENFAKVNEGFARMESKFAVLKAGQERITELLTAHLGGSGGSVS
jgi:chromosome segregation ATPase